MRTTLGALEAAYYAFRIRCARVHQADRARWRVDSSRVDAELLAALLVAGFASSGSITGRRRFRTRLEQNAADVFGTRIPDRHGIADRPRRNPVLWSIAAITAFFLLWHDHALRRNAHIGFMLGVIIVRTTMLVARFLPCAARAVVSDCCPSRIDRRARLYGSRCARTL
jgi:hypothetical protein